MLLGNIAQCGLDCDWVGGAVRVVGTSLRPGDWGSRSGIENGAEAWGHSICVQGGARSAGGGARDGRGTGTEEHTDPRPLCRWFLPLTSAFCPSDTGPRSRLQVGHWVGRVQWMTGQAKHSPFPAKSQGTQRWLGERPCHSQWVFGGLTAHPGQDCSLEGLRRKPDPLRLLSA